MQFYLQFLPGIADSVATVGSGEPTHMLITLFLASLFVVIITTILLTRRYLPQTTEAPLAPPSYPFPPLHQPVTLPHTLLLNMMDGLDWDIDRIVAAPEVLVLGEDVTTRRFVPDLGRSKRGIVYNLVLLMRIRYGLLRPTVANRLLIRQAISNCLDTDEMFQDLRLSDRAGVVSVATVMSFVPTKDDIAAEALLSNPDVVRRIADFRDPVPVSLFWRVWTWLIGPDPVPLPLWRRFMHWCLQTRPALVFTHEA